MVGASGATSMRIGFALVVALGCAAAILTVTSAASQGEATPGAWESADPASLARTEVAATRVGGHIYVVGGFGPGAVPSADVERFDPATGEWKLIEPMPTTLNHAGAVAYRGDLYVLGGFVDVPRTGLGRTSDRFFRYRPDTGEWSELASMPVARAAFAAGVIDGRLHVAGGATARENTTTRMDVYDFRKRRWRPGPPMRVPREHVAGAVAGAPGNKRFYVLGGRDFYGSDNYRTVERFDPRRRRWRHLPDMGVAHGGFAAVGVGRRVVAMGGERPGVGATGTLAATEVYHPRRGAWRRLPDMITPRHGHGVAAVGRRIYAIAGGPITLVAVSNAVETIDLPRGRKRGRR